MLCALLKQKIRFISVVVLVFSATAKNSFAISMPSLTNLDTTMLKNVTHTFAAATFFKPVEPASNFGVAALSSSKKQGGKRLGLSLGVEVGEVSALKIKDYYSGNVGILPSAMAVAVLGLPLFGFGVEFGMLPPRTFGKFSFEQYGGNVKWTFTDLMWTKERPFHLALRAGYTVTQLGFSQTMSTTIGTPLVSASGTTTVGVGFKSQVTTASLSFSKEFGLVEPYCGVGYFSQSSSVTANGSVSIFSQSLSTSNTVTVQSAHLHFFVGFQMQLLLPTLSMEYLDVGGINGYALKFSLRY